MKFTPTAERLRRLPLGMTPYDGGCYFAVWAPEAAAVTLHFFDRADRELSAVQLRERKGGIWYDNIPGLTAGTCYAVEACGRDEPERGYYFKEGRLLVDPYAKILTKPFAFDAEQYAHDSAAFIPKGVVPPAADAFDWDQVEKPHLQRHDLIIYEAHVRGLTKLCPLIPAPLRGTYLGLAQPQVLDHLERLGITAVQLMPIAASMSEPDLTARGLCNYWGYNPVCFMAPDPRFAVDPFAVRDEFRTMVRELHRRHIAVLLDVVFNHTAEGGFGGPVLSFKGLDNRGYYAFGDGQDGFNYRDYYNASGCGNSFNVDGRQGLNLVLDALIYWLEFMRVDGFRFDLAVTLNREYHGAARFAFEPNSGFFKSCYCDELLSDSLMIAEPWDTGPDGYRLGQFPPGWSEQNDRFRDTVRRFWRGDRGIIGDLATRMLGSRDIFTKGRRSINASVNYVTYHDGFTLEDLVSYNGKHNELNGYNNSDGTAENFSTNCGEEGVSQAPQVLKRRRQLKRNLIASTLIAQGVPHLLAGDEFAHTQLGNNNAYCQDNDLSYVPWSDAAEHRDFMRFIGRCAQIRRNSLAFSELNLEDDNYHLGRAVFDARWFNPDGSVMEAANWNDPNQNALLLYAGDSEGINREHWCVIFNNSVNDIYFTLPDAPPGKVWSACLDTSEADGEPRRFSDGRGLAMVAAAHAIKVLVLADAAPPVTPGQPASPVTVSGRKEPD